MRQHSDGPWVLRSIGCWEPQLWGISLTWIYWCKDPNTTLTSIELLLVTSRQDTEVRFLPSLCAGSTLVLLSNKHQYKYFCKSCMKNVAMRDRRMTWFLKSKCFLSFWIWDLLFNIRQALPLKFTPGPSRCILSGLGSSTSVSIASTQMTRQTTKCCSALIFFK